MVQANTMTLGVWESKKKTCAKRKNISCFWCLAGSREYIKIPGYEKSFNLVDI